ncbi:MAG: tRNA (adenosine(37)-N6)-dimethylallyltransferase MiaA [Parcubacteria group bacterium]|nr:tRNA (adenosine(37)-N6)-dimethylallyltransferase MiaA [Parcubacteria group bacterium]
MQKLPKLIVIVAPTASGKTEMSIMLAKKFNGEIVSADSRAVYKWMNVGTAKPIREKIKHHMINVVRPDEEFTLSDFKEKALKSIQDIIKRGKVPFLVGGTGLYIQAIVDNFQIPEVSPDKKLRKKLRKETINQLFKKLKKLDSESADQIGENKIKLIRALEVCLKTNKKFSELTKKGEPIFDILQIGISHSREKLYKRINLRAKKMLDAGLLKEVRSIVAKLKKRGLKDKNIWQLSSMTGIGYKQVGMYLRGEVDLQEATRIIQRDTRHYARRQIVWFKRDKKIKWVKTTKEAETLFKKHLKK